MSYICLIILHSLLFLFLVYDISENDIAVVKATHYNRGIYVSIPVVTEVIVF